MSISSSIFLIKPIVGEITDKAIIFLVNTSYSTTLKLNINGQFHSTYQTNSATPTRLIVDIEVCSIKTYTWLRNGIIVSEHRLGPNIDTLVFVSCDLTEADTKHSLWNKISTDEKSGLCIHLGDNIYGDRVYQDTVQDYDNRYSKTWSKWIDLLTDFSHIMVADDHEVVDGYGYADRLKPESQAGLTAYKNYQVALLNDSKGDIIVKKINSDTTIYAISRTMIDTTPMEKLRQYRWTMTDKIILAFSSAPVPVTNGISGSIYTSIFGSSGWEDPDLKDLYDFCFDLLTTNQVQQIILIGGDIHIGVSGTVSKGNHHIDVYVPSGISSHPTVIESICATAINGRYDYQGYQMDFTAKAKRNYLSIGLPLKPTTPGKIIYNNESYPHDIKAYLSEMYYMLKNKL